MKAAAVSRFKVDEGSSMSVLASIRSQLAPIHREGYPFIGAFALASLILFWLWSPLGWLGTLATLWCAYFFRDPARVTPVREGLVVSPADGRVSRVTNAVPPKELELGERAAAARVDLHERVRLPREPQPGRPGRIERIVYHAGAFLNADLDKASEDNERNSLVIVADESAHRRGADRRPDRAPHRLLRARRARRSAPASASA